MGGSCLLLKKRLIPLVWQTRQLFLWLQLAGLRTLALQQLLLELLLQLLLVKVA